MWKVKYINIKYIEIFYGNSVIANIMYVDVICFSMYWTIV